MKRILSLFVVLVMMLSAFAVCVSAAELSPSIEFEMLTGAAIRIGDVNGMRFYSSLDNADREQIAALRAAGYTVEMGTLIAPADLTPENAEATLGSSGELTFDTPTTSTMMSISGKVVESQTYLVVKYNSAGYFTDGGFTGFVGSIVNIKELLTDYSNDSGNITRDFIGRGYIKVTAPSGEVTYSYASYAENDVANNSRSLQEIAAALKSDTSSYNQLSSEAKSIVTSWAGRSRVEWSPPY